MGQASPQRDSTLISIAAITVLISSWLPWAVLSGPFGPLILAGTQLSTILNAWNSHIRLFGVQFPNSFPILVAFALMILAWARASGAWIAPRALSMSLAVFGLYYGVRFLLAVAREGIIGIGSLLTTAAFAAILAVLVLQPRPQDHEPADDAEFR